MLCRMIPRKRRTGKVPVYLNVYDLTPINGYTYWVGLRVYHSGVQVFEAQSHFGYVPVLVDEDILVPDSFAILLVASILTFIVFTPWFHKMCNAL